MKIKANRIIKEHHIDKIKQYIETIKLQANQDWYDKEYCLTN